MMTNQPQRIMFIEATGAMGGVEFSTLYLARHMNPAQWCPVVVCPEEGLLADTCRQAGIEVIIVPRPAFRSTSFWLGKNRRLPNPIAWVWNSAAISIAALNLDHCLATRQPTLIITKGLLAHFYGGLAARRRGILCLWHVQDFISERFGGIYRWGFGQVAKWLPHHIIVDGRSISGQLPPQIQNRVTVVLNGVDTDMFRPDLDGAPTRQKFNIPTKALVVGHVARMTPWKGQHHLLQAFSDIADQVPQSYLLFVGAAVFDNDSYEKHLHQQVRSLGLENRVIFAGYQTDLPHILAAMNIFAHTSTEKDTSPLALLSAMAAGLPIVAYDIVGIREVIKNNETGILIPVGEKGLLAQTIINMALGKKYRDEIGAKARMAAVEQLSLERHTSQIEQVFRQVCASRQ